MATREQTFAAFFETYGVTDDKLRQALERLWYSRSMSWLRHGHERKAPDDKLSDEAE